MSKAKTWICIALLAIFCFAFAGDAGAQGFSDSKNLPHASPEDGPMRVGIGIKIDQITFVDQKAENFGAVATIELQWQDPALAFDEEDFGREYRLFGAEPFIEYANDLPTTIPIFVIKNQQGNRWIQDAVVVVRSNGAARYLERVSLTLQAPEFDFTKYPFDTQIFTLEIVSVNPIDLVEFVPIVEKSGLGDKLGEEEWILENAGVFVTTTTGLTGIDSTMAELVFQGRRHVQYYLLRIFLPLLILAIVAWAMFFLEEYRKRIEIAGANLLAFIAFNFAISGDLPKLGYTTFLDFILMWMFLITGSIIVFNVALRRLKVSGHEELARRIDNYAIKWIYPLGYAAIIGFAVFTFLGNPFGQ